jgi:peroxin-5
MSGLRDVFTGGQCNADGTPLSQSSNPFKNFINQLVQDPGRQRQLRPGFATLDPSQAQLNDVMALMDQTWTESTLHSPGQRLEYEQRVRESMLMEQAFVESQMAEQELMHRQALMHQQWQQHADAETAAGWRTDFMQHEVLDSREGALNTAFQQASEEVHRREVEDKEATSGLISIMMTDPEPKFQNSKFLDFLKRVETGEFEITNDNRLLVHPEKAKPDVAADKSHLLHSAFDQARAQELHEAKSTTRSPGLAGMDAAFAQAAREEEISEKKLGRRG